MLRLTMCALSIGWISTAAMAQAPLTKDDLVRQLKPPPLTRSLSGGGALTRQIVVEPGREQEVIAAKANLPKINMRVQFEFNSAVLTPDGRATLKVLADALQDPALHGQRFLVGGHTDALGSDQYNDGLSNARALSVRDHLVATYHIPPERLQTMGFGKRELADPAHPDAPENRRVEIVTLPSAQ